MSVKRVSDLEPIRLANIISSVDDAYYGGSQLKESRMEISWNTNPRYVANNDESTGDDNIFQSKSITFEAISAGIVDPVLNRNVAFYGNKDLNGNLNIINSGLSVNAHNSEYDIHDSSQYHDHDIHLHGNYVCVNGKQDITVQARGDIWISAAGVAHFRGYEGIDLNTDTTAITMVKLVDKDQIILSSGTYLNIYGSYCNLVYDNTLTIYHRTYDSLTNKEILKPMLDFQGDTVYAYGKWYFPESYPGGGLDEKGNPDKTTRTIDGYINHAYYS